MDVSAVTIHLIEDLDEKKLWDALYQVSSAYTLYVPLVVISTQTLPIRIVYPL